MIYHLTSRPEWDHAVVAGEYRADTLETEGFIHCSTAQQWPRVLEQRFPGRADLLLLEVDPARTRAVVRWEDLEGSGERFPHVYGALPVDSVISVQSLST